MEEINYGSHRYDQAFFDLCQGLNQKIPGSYPVLVYNPHPFSVKTAITSEFMLADQDHGKASYIAHVFDGEKELPAQLQKERSDIPIHWRKQVAFLAELPPFSMHLYEIVMERKPADPCAVPPDDFCFETERLAFQLNPETGLIDRYEVDGQSMLCQGAGEIRVWEDNEDPWGMQRKRFAKKILGAFRLATPAETAKIAANGLESMKPIRIVEQGPVQTVIEAVYCYGKSDAVIRYTLPRCGVSVKAEIRIHNHEKNAMLKWMLPTALQDSVCYGNTMFGMEELAADGGEMISQDFVMMKNSAQAFGVIHKGVYGSHCENGELGISMLRGAAYCAHPVEDRRILRQDRVSSRIDQGERNFQFVLCGGKKDEFLQTLVQETELAKIPPKAVHWFPAKGKESTLPLVEIDNPVVEISGLKKLRQEEGYLLRLFNASPDSQTYHLKSEVWKLETAGELKGFEIQTFHISEGKVQKSELLDL